MRGGEHKPFQTPCPGTVSWGVGPLYQHKKRSEGPVPAVHETTLVNGIPVHGLPSVLECGVTGSGHPAEWNGTNFGDSPGPHGPWTLHLPLPAQTFEQAGTVDLSTCRKRSFKNVQARRSWHGRYPFSYHAGQPNLRLACGGYSPGLSFEPYTPGVEDLKYCSLSVSTVITVVSRDDEVPGAPAGTTARSSRTVSVDKTSGVISSSGSDDYGNWTDSGGIPRQLDDGGVVSLWLIGLADWNFATAMGYFSAIITPGSSSYDFVINSNGGSATINTGYSAGQMVEEWSFSDGSYYRALWGVLAGGDPFHPVFVQTDVETMTMSPTSLSYSHTHTAGIFGHPVVESQTCAASLSGPNPSSYVYDDVRYLKSLWDLNDDILYPWRTDGNVGIAPLVTRNEVQHDVGIIANTGYHVNGTTLVTDFYGNAPGSVSTDPGQLPLADPQTYSETYNQIPWVDPNATLGCDGSILGAPLPAGYGWNADGTPQGIFDFRHEVDDWCWPDDFPEHAKFLDTFNYGARTPYYLPQNCSQWTSDFDALYATAGKFLFFNGRISGSSAWTQIDTPLWIQDWKQAEDTWPSYNFARPAGADRFVFDETTPSWLDKVFQYLSGYSTGTGDTIILGNAPILVVDLNGNSPLSSFDDPGQLPLEDGVHHPVDYIETWGPGGSATLPTIGSTEVWGGQSVGGFYHVTRLSDTSVLLGVKVFDVPTGWLCPSGDMDTAFGPLRFPDCPGILGRVAINSISLDVPPFCFLNIESSPYLATKITASPSYSEQVDFLEADGTVLVANQAVTRVNNSQFTVPNSGATAYAIIAEAKFIVVHGAAAYYWDDTTPKGNLLTAEFKFDYRLRAETQRINEMVATWPAGYPDCDCSPLGSTQTVPFSEYSDFILTQTCVPFTQCGPRVPPMPAFPSSFPLDSQHGSRWQACVISAVYDLLWQKPHVPPGFIDPLTEVEVTTFAWAEDDGTGQTNTVAPTVAFFAHGPLVEPFLYMPTAGLSGTEAAPSLLAGMTIGFTSPATNSDSQTLGAPSPGGWVPWGLHQNLCGCVGAGGRFSGIYAAFTLDC